MGIISNIRQVIGIDNIGIVGAGGIAALKWGQSNFPCFLLPYPFKVRRRSRVCEPMKPDFGKLSRVTQPVSRIFMKRAAELLG